jgi:O-antigen ligase
MIGVTVQQSDADDSFNAQLGIRLTAYLLAALSVFLALGRRKMQLGAPVLAWVLVPTFVIATALYAPDPLFALTAGMAHLALLLFAWRMVTRHGQLRVVFAIVITGTIVGALSIATYYAVPDFGRSVSDSLAADPGGRMRGVTAQPNSLGTIAALTALLAIMHFQAFTAKQRTIAIAAIFIAAFCLVYSVSRINILGLVLCVGLWAFCRSNPAFNLFGVVGVALVACLLIGFVPDLSVYLSREGARADDLASFNGRREIWDVVWENIRVNPLLGHGYGASGDILRQDDRLFAAAVNSHNAYLELLFTGGAVLLMLYAIAVSTAIVRTAKEGRVEPLIALIFYLVVGVSQATPFSGLPLFSAAIFYFVVSLCLARSSPRPHAAGRPLQPSWAQGLPLTRPPDKRRR